MSGKGNEAYEKLDREITAKYGHLYQRIDPNVPAREFRGVPVKTMAEGIADLIMNRAIYQDREGEGMTAYDRESHEYQYCQNAAQSILELLTAAGFGPVKAAQEAAFDQGQKSGIRHAARLAATARMGRPDLPGPMSPNPYRAATIEALP